MSFFDTSALLSLVILNFFIPKKLECKLTFMVIGFNKSYYFLRYYCFIEYLIGLIGCDVGLYFKLQETGTE